MSIYSAYTPDEYFIHIANCLGVHRTFRKEINELESSTVFGVSEENSIEYDNQNKKIRRIIKNLTEEKDRELRMLRKTYFYWRKKICGNNSISIKKISNKLVQIGNFN